MSRELDCLHVVLLDILADRHEAMSTAQLRVSAGQDPRLNSKLVHETVYRALQRLRRLCRVDQHPSDGRDTVWTIAPPAPGGRHHQ